MTIAPVIRSIDVKVAPDRAFDLFATRMSLWWPRGKTIGKRPHAEIVLEPWPGGRWFERDDDGQETRWGQVLEWQPPSRLLLGWQIGADWTYVPDLLTEVELTFAANDGGGTRVTLEHRKLERLGADAERIAEALGGGWPPRLAGFAAYADAQP